MQQALGISTLSATPWAALSDLGSRAWHQCVSAESCCQSTKVSFGADDPTSYDMRLAERRAMDDRMFGEARAKGMVGEASPVFDEVASIAGEIRETGYAAAVSLLKGADNRAILPTLDQPTLVIAGANDRIAPAPQTKAVAEAVPGARLEVVADAGHAAYMEQPDAYNTLLKDFLDD